MTNENLIAIVESRNPLLLQTIDTKIYRYDPEYDSHMSVLSDLSKSFYERGFFFLFKVNNTEIDMFSVELCIFLEEFCKITEFAFDESVKTFDVVFYEQGAEFLLSFSRLDDEFYGLRFNDRNSRFQIADSRGNILDLQLMLFTFYSRITFLAGKLCPSIAKNELFIDWRATVESFVNR